MMTLSNILLLTSCWFMRCRTLRYLHYLQQEEYNCKRFGLWLLANRAYDLRGSLLILALFFIQWLVTPYSPISLFATFMTSLGLFLITKIEKDPRYHGKLTLKMTERATRIYKASLFVGFSMGIIFLAACPLWLAIILFFQLTPLYLAVATALLAREEKKRQQQYAAEARAILASVSPYVIGITGSYGKTSTKNALGQLLQITLGPTFWPAKSINTPMGNTREIRNGLQKGYKYAIFEMGAYGRGSITRLCALTPPDAAIITSIGTAHLERFGSKENIYLTKAELAQALPRTGILVCNGDDEGARGISVQHPTAHTLCYGFDLTKGPLDCRVDTWHTTDQGTRFTLEWQGKLYDGFIPLFGKTNLSNCVAAFCLACALGAHPDYVIAAMHTLEPVDNRLQVKKYENVTFVNDAYNSNPTGFKAALEVMQSLPGGRRILVTPGMIELGPIQNQENEKVAHSAAQLCDMAIIVGATNKKALLTGLQAGGLASEQILHCHTRDAALAQLKKLQRDGDIILLENDLTDLYEGKVTF